MQQHPLKAVALVAQQHDQHLGALLGSDSSAFSQRFCSVVRGMVGVDIGCGMETVALADREIDFKKLDLLIRREIPYGREVRGEPHPLSEAIDLTKLRCAGRVKLDRAVRSIGTLGGGSHFIEVDRAEDGRRPVYNFKAAD